MDTISTTASGNFNNKKLFSGIRKHLEHDPNLKHKNEYLNTPESKNLRKYNSHKILIDFDDWTEENFGSFVKEHDENMVDKKRKFKTVKRFLEVDGNGKARKLQPVQLYTQKFSNEKDWTAFKDQLVEKLQKKYTWPKTGKHLTKEEATDYVYKLIANGLKDCANGFNDRNPNLKMFEYYVHMDEKGAPHFHSDVLPFYQPEGTTKKGRKKKPSWSLNTVLAHQYGTTRSKSQAKENLKKFREQEDKALIECINNRLENDLGIKNALSFVRLTDKDKTVETGKDHDVYVAQKQKLDDLQAKVKDLEAKHTKALEQCKQDQAQAESQQKVIAENQGKLDDIANWQSLVATYQSQAKDAEQEKKDAKAARDQALQAQRQAEEAKKQAEQQAQQANQSLIDQLNQQKQKQDAREINLSHREKGYTDSEGKYHIGIEAREKAVTARESAVAKKESALADYDNKIAEKKKTLKDYSNNLEAKKNAILKTKNKELNDSYKKLKAGYSADLKRLKTQKKQLQNHNAVQFKFATFASYVYHQCAETFIKTIDPSTNQRYNCGYSSYKESKNSIAYDQARGQYHPMMGEETGKTGLDYCIEAYNTGNNSRHLWTALKATGKKLVSLVTSGKAKDLIRRIDLIDDKKLDDTTVKQATAKEMLEREKQRQQKQKQHQKERQNIHIVKPEPIKDDGMDFK